jgi:hypothetical protein
VGCTVAARAQSSSLTFTSPCLLPACVSRMWCAAYLDDSVGYPIAVDELVPVQGGAEVVWWFQVRCRHSLSVLRSDH